MSEREKFGAEELLIVMSNYDVGSIQKIKEFPRGSRKAPKLHIVAERGEYLLKRRARGKDDPFKVAFAHSIQLYLASKKFPLPALVGTRKENNSMFQYHQHVYELFEFIHGDHFDNSLEATFDSGRALALYHKLLRDFKPPFEPPVGSYHNAENISAALEQIPTTFSNASRFPGEPPEDLDQTMAFLREAYGRAAERVTAGGINEWPSQIVHADWHPGNTLYRKRKVVAVIDYDAARLQQRIIDLANGVLQFSILGGGEDPATWPDYLDESRFKRFVRGYDEIDVVSVAELKVLPPLMVEAMIAEAVLPIAATGTFGRIEGFPFLKMIERKVRWIQQHTDRLAAAITA